MRSRHCTSFFVTNFGKRPTPNFPQQTQFFPRPHLRAIFLNFPSTGNTVMHLSRWGGGGVYREICCHLIFSASGSVPLNRFLDRGEDRDHLRLLLLLQCKHDFFTWCGDKFRKCPQSCSLGWAELRIFRNFRKSTLDNGPSCVQKSDFQN